MPAQGTALVKEPCPDNPSPEGATSIRSEMFLKVWKWVRSVQVDG